MSVSLHLSSVFDFQSEHRAEERDVRFVTSNVCVERSAPLRFRAIFNIVPRNQGLLRGVVFYSRIFRGLMDIGCRPDRLSEIGRVIAFVTFEFPLSRVKRLKPTPSFEYGPVQWIRPTPPKKTDRVSSSRLLDCLKERISPTVLFMSVFEWARVTSEMWVVTRKRKPTAVPAMAFPVHVMT